GTFNRWVCEAMLAYARARVGSGDENRTLHILELGAGSGGTTAMLLPALKPYVGRVTYDYTDISESFLQHGRKQFGKAQPFVRFRKFNVERNAAAQGFAAGTFDLVIASNV